MINARAQNAYGIAHFAQQNAVPQARWENIDIIGQYIDNLQKQKALEMADKNYELEKDKTALYRDKFNWEKDNHGKVTEADRFKKDASLEELMLKFKNDKEIAAINNKYKMGEIAARQNALSNAENREWALIESGYFEAANRAKEEIAELQKSLKTAPTEEIANKIGGAIQGNIKNFANTFFIPYDTDLNKLRKDPVSFRGKVFNYQQNLMGVKTKHLDDGDA